MKGILKNKLSIAIISIAVVVAILSAIFFYVNNFNDNKNVIENNLFTDEYIKAGAEGKFGLINKQGTVVMPFKYDDVIYDNESGLAAVLLNGKWGFADKKGNIKIKCEYDDVGLFGKSSLAPVLKEDKWGYIDRSGKIVVECKYSTAKNFSDNGLAAVTGDGKPYYINTNGKKAFETQYDMIGEFNDNGYAVVSAKEKFGIINLKGKEIVELKYDREFSIDKKGYAVVSNGEKYGVVNIKGENILPFEYDFVMPTLAMYNSSEVKSGFSKAFFIIFVNQLLESYNLFDDNDVAIAVKDGKAGLVNSRGKTILEPKFEQIQVYRESDVVLVSDGDKYMYYGIDGKPLANGGKFDKTNGFNNGLGVVVKDTKWGYIDKKGAFAIEPQFDAASGFAKNGLASVRKAEKWGYINKKGAFAIEPSYDYASTFVQNIAKVNDGKTWSIIKSDGNKIIDNLALEPVLYNDGYIVVESDEGKYVLYDFNGNTISKTKCDVIGDTHKSTRLCQYKKCYKKAVIETSYCEEHGVQ